MKNTNDLVGTWRCNSAISDGKPLPKETTDILRLTLTADRYKTEKGTEVLFDSTYTLEPSQSPPWINLVGTEGDFKGKIGQGIYSLEGDVLRMCYTMPGLPRPQAFESSAGSRATLVTWQRESKSSQ